jgi:hypothetical protein
LIVGCFCQDCTDLNYPLQYVVHKLNTNQKVIFDGRLDEPLWQEVAWTDKFVDIEGSTKPLPYYYTQAKMRWDDDYLYIAAYLQEPHVWSNLTVNNSIIYHDNDFEIFIDPDGSTHFYKELELNARNVNWNLLMVRPYLNGGPPVCNFTVPGQCVSSAPEWGVQFWDISPYLPSGVFINGTLNNPTLGSTFWSLEIGIPIRQYLRYNQPQFAYPPRIGQYWRVDFSRVQWEITIHDNPDGSRSYWKVPGKPENNWVWQPTYVNPPNMHLPETWGYIQFADDRVNATPAVKDPQWPVRDALAKVYGAEVVLQNAGNGYSTNLMVLVSEGGLPQYVADGTCAEVPVIMLSEEYGFLVMVQKENMLGHMRGDRYIWFEEVMDGTIINT